MGISNVNCVQKQSHVFVLVVPFLYATTHCFTEVESPQAALLMHSYRRRELTGRWLVTEDVIKGGMFCWFRVAEILICFFGTILFRRGSRNVTSLRILCLEEEKFSTKQKCCAVFKTRRISILNKNVAQSS